METMSSLPASFPSIDSISETTEEKEIDSLVRVSSFPLNQQRRRRVGYKSPSFASRPRREQSFGHAAAETYLLTCLSFKLLSYLGVGYRWMTRLIALAVYATLLMPGFLQIEVVLGKTANFDQLMASAQKAIENGNSED
ncbi:hypothetical protein CASFOL_008402 [Castilleja foliolosa]|uniref:Uncharacterized protein n=1 Tax=Castilleja foliolosa TaxID=1961234 RepID=A0ABD3E2W3_9LAMI